MNNRNVIYLAALSILLLTSCFGTPKKPQEKQADSISTVANSSGNSMPQGFDSRFAIVFPYVEVYDYKDNEEYEEQDFDEENESAYTPVLQNDTIAFGGIDNDYAILNGTFELEKKWICIDLPFTESESYNAKAKTGTTVSHSEDWLGEPITVMDIKDFSPLIAFQGEFNESDFTFHKGLLTKEKEEKAAELLTTIRNAYDSEQLSKPEKLTTDTLLFMHSVAYSGNPDIYAVLLKTTEYSDSDYDNTNQLMYIISDNTVRFVTGGMSCYGPFSFRLHNKEYLLLLYHSYASATITLFDISKSLSEPIFTSYVIGD